jgi:glycerate-2-kinase
MFALKRKYSIQENDLIICLISGGGSALMCYPAQGITLIDKQKITDLLIRTGADIKEINLVRKCLSEIKAGGLTRFFAPARVVGLIISDVVGNGLDVIASGPSASCSLNFHSAYNVLKKYNLLSKSPKSVVRFLKDKSSGVERNKKKIARDCDNYIIGDIRTALEAMANYAKAKGLKPVIIKKPMSGDTNNLARLMANKIIKGKYSGYNIIISGGETSLKLPEEAGQGGRNQHYAGKTMLAMEKYAGEWALVAMNSDGADYLKGIAGAIIDNNSLTIARDKKIDIASYLKKYNSYGLMKRMGNSLIITGNTGTNVGDVAVYAI